MSITEKILKWAHDNGYRANFKYSWCPPNPIYLTQEYGLQCGYVVMKIAYDTETKQMCSCIQNVSEIIIDREMLNELYIPLNNVNRDEKLLQKYLKE